MQEQRDVIIKSLRIVLASIQLLFPYSGQQKQKHKKMKLDSSDERKKKVKELI